MQPTSKQSKVSYVRKQKQFRGHHCHWPGCKKHVPPAMWGCKVHWFTLPKTLRDEIWEAYIPGQEIRGTPSRAYVIVARRVQEWIKEYIREQESRTVVERKRLEVEDRHDDNGTLFDN